MTRYWILYLATTALLSPGVWAQPTTVDDANDQRKRLIEQKLRLVESLMAAPAAVAPADSHDPELPTLLAMGKRFLERIRAALAANRLDDADLAVDEALRSAAKPANRPSAGADGPGGRARQTVFAGLTEQVETYRIAIDDLARQGNAQARACATRIAASQAEARKLGDTGQWTQANRVLDLAYHEAIETLSELRAGQTVTLSLSFDTPQAEYAYELKRYESTRMLADMMIDDGRAAGERRNLVEGFLRDGRKMQVVATGQARDGDHKGAITTMETAVGLMNRALQSMGVPAF